MPGWYEISSNDKGQYSFVLKAANGEVILRSQQYTARDGAVAGVASVQANSAQDDHFERAQASDGRPYFNLKAANHQIIGTSQMYASTATRDAGIESVKSNGPSAAIKAGG